MNITKVITSTLLLSLTFYTYPDQRLNQKSLWQKTIGAIAESYPMYWLEKKIGEKLSDTIIEMHQLGDMPATPHYQALGKEAQSAVGIPEEYHVPIKKMPQTNPLAGVAAGFAMPHAIYMNEEKLNELSYGVQRCAVYHEAIHKKYNDDTVDDVSACITFFGTAYVTHKILQTITPNLYLIVRVLGMCGSGIISTNIVCTEYYHYRERRADIEGCYATQCATCVQEAATHRRKRFEEENHPFKNNGCLQADEMEIIAHDLKQENKLCIHHTYNA